MSDYEYSEEESGGGGSDEDYDYGSDDNGGRLRTFRCVSSIQMICSQFKNIHPFAALPPGGPTGGGGGATVLRREDSIETDRSKVAVLRFVAPRVLY